ncbi:hypothetical protein RRG08_024499 [Elysia crispata]|uniref:Uncharacterized protein n=1 Tax=Elysia crispata TaxID=231223 RepID=A0AAE1D2U6_9GAST|nr:hypothetical protein RRG08_024499 [Elysia crispata]
MIVVAVVDRGSQEDVSVEIGYQLTGLCGTAPKTKRVRGGGTGRTETSESGQAHEPGQSRCDLARSQH